MRRSFSQTAHNRTQRRACRKRLRPIRRGFSRKCLPCNFAGSCGRSPLIQKASTRNGASPFTAENAVINLDNHPTNGLETLMPGIGMQPYQSVAPGPQALYINQTAESQQYFIGNGSFISALSGITEFDDNDQILEQETIVRNHINSERKPYITSLYQWLEKLTILKILGLLGNLSIAVGVASYILTEQQRHRADVYQAWQVITTAYGQSGDGGRKKALEFLNASPGVQGRRRFPAFWLIWERERLTGLEVPKAYLRDLNLPNSAIVRGNLREAYLVEAVFTESDLRGTDFRSATLAGASFTKATVAGADFRETDLNQAILTDAFYTSSNSSVDICDFFQLSHPCPTYFPSGYDSQKHGLVLVQASDISTK